MLEELAVAAQRLLASEHGRVACRSLAFMEQSPLLQPSQRLDLQSLPR